MTNHTLVIVLEFNLIKEPHKSRANIPCGFPRVRFMTRQGDTHVPNKAHRKEL